ncbi:MAG: gluconokinase [Candidatus Acidiferrum sp.]|jgi:gluconokinase
MIVAVMGVTGSGKTTIGESLAKRLGWEYADADDFHSAANKDKMHRGIPLTDADRLPWLAAIHEKLAQSTAAGRNLVLACSALKQSYRDLLFRDLQVRLVYLKGSYEFIDERLRARKGHFADDKILAAQFADLQEPTDALVVDIRPDPERIVDEICERLSLPASA